jgi:hypothetical protein
VGFGRVYMFGLRRDDVWMAEASVSGELVAGSRRRRNVLERRQFVQDTTQAGASLTWVR